MTANAIRDWCRFTRAGSAYIEPRSPWRQDYNHHRPHSALGMLTPFAASLRQPPRLPTATAAGEGGDQGYPLPTASGAPQTAVFPALQQQSPAEEITSPQVNRRGSYRGSTIPSTPLSQQVDR
jgi:integrase-like protein